MRSWKPWCAGLFARLAAGMRWGVQTADALAWLPGWQAREPGLLARLAAEAPALLSALAARFLPQAGARLPPHGLAPGAHLKHCGLEETADPVLQKNQCCFSQPDQPGSAQLRLAESSTSMWQSLHLYVALSGRAGGHSAGGGSPGAP